LSGQLSIPFQFELTREDLQCTAESSLLRPVVKFQFFGEVFWVTVFNCKLKELGLFAQLNTESLKEMSDTDNIFPLKKKANRNRNSEEMAKVADLSQIPRLMQCCLCGGIPSPNSVSMCQDGHLTCGGCHRQTPEGLCPKDLGYTTKEYREFKKICNKKCSTLNCALYSYFFDNSIFNCNYAYLGCAMAKYGYDFVHHRQNCKYRPILPCAFSDCQIRASPMAYSKHLIEFHQIFEVDSDTHRVQVPCQPIDVDSLEIIRRRWVGGLFNCLGLTFILLAEELGPDIYIWIALASAVNTEGRKFQCRLGFASEKGEITWKGDVYPFERVYEKDLDSEEIFQVRKAIVAKKFVFKVGGQHFWHTDVEIKELFPEGYIPPGNLSLLNEIADLSIQGDTTPNPNPGLRVEKIYENVFDEVPGSEEKILDSTNSTLQLEKPRPRRRTGNKESELTTAPIANKDGRNEFLPTPKPRPKKKNTSDDLQQKGVTGHETIGKSGGNILSNGHSNDEPE